MIQDILESARTTLERLLSATVIYDPQPVKDAEPHVRLTFTGSGNQGSLDTISFQLSVVASGDGPDVFLRELVLLSLRVQDLFNRTLSRIDLTLGDGSVARLFFKPLATGSAGQFVENENDTERRWRYTYVEAHIITVSFPREQR